MLQRVSHARIEREGAQLARRRGRGGREGAGLRGLRGSSGGGRGVGGADPALRERESLQGAFGAVEAGDGGVEVEAEGLAAGRALDGHLPLAHLRDTPPGRAVEGLRGAVRPEVHHRPVTAHPRLPRHFGAEGRLRELQGLGGCRAGFALRLSEALREEALKHLLHVLSLPPIHHHKVARNLSRLRGLRGLSLHGSAIHRGAARVLLLRGGLRRSLLPPVVRELREPLAQKPLQRCRHRHPLLGVHRHEVARDRGLLLLLAALDDLLHLGRAPSSARARRALLGRTLGRTGAERLLGSEVVLEHAFEEALHLLAPRVARLLVGLLRPRHLDLGAEVLREDLSHLLPVCAGGVNLAESRHLALAHPALKVVGEHGGDLRAVDALALLPGAAHLLL